MNSMQKLKDLKMDILCDGHQGIIQPAKRALLYIQGFMEFGELVDQSVSEYRILEASSISSSQRWEDGGGLELIQNSELPGINNYQSSPNPSATFFSGTN